MTNFVPARAIAAAFALGWVLVAVRPAYATEAPVQFTDTSSSAAMRAAILALKISHPGENIPLSEVSAALVNLVDGAPPQLLVQLTGGYCGSLGCSFTLYEQGTTSWLIVNDWIVGSVAVSQHRTGLWHDFVLNGSVTWEHRGRRYVPSGPKSGGQ